jgi:hypothetical protein
MASTQDVTFTTIDGIKLKGTLYAAAVEGPGVVLSPPVSRDGRTLRA